MTTLFTGRYIEIHVFPFSFAEFCRYYEEEKDIAKLFGEYVIKGCLAGSYEYRTDRDRTNYIRDVYDTIINRDLVTKYHLPDTTTLEHLAEFMMDNVSNLTSPNNISDTGIRFARLGRRNLDYGRMYENIVCIELMRREYDPLLKIKDAYPKLILANTRHETYDYEGIKIYNLADWLLEKN